MKLILHACLLLVVCRGKSGALPTDPMTFDQAQGPPIDNAKQGSTALQEPQPPSIDGIDFGFRAPAPPEGLGPQPPSPPNPALLELFQKNPAAFTALYSNKEKRDVTDRRYPTYDQFLTAAVISGIDLRNREYTMFAPEDNFFKKFNISLPILALKNKNCVAQIVRSHIIKGIYPLLENSEEKATSLQESPIFFTYREANRVQLIRPNIAADYGVVHIIDGLIDRLQLVDVCPFLNESEQLDGQASQHNINQRKVSDLDSLFIQPSSDGNTIDNFYDEPLTESIEQNQPEYSLPEDDFSLELLDNIDNFAHAIQLSWKSEDSVINKLENLQTTIFLALLERSNLINTLASDGPWTIFAPDDNAWRNLPQETFDHIVKNPQLLKDVLSYHIIKGNATRRHFGDSLTLPSLHDNLPVFINFYTDGWASWYTASGSQIINLDESASNGVVHIVRSVLSPPNGDLYTTVQWTPALQMSFGLLQNAFISDLFNESATVTAFLPVDSPEMEEILTSRTLPSSSASILSRHVVPGTWFESGLIDEDQIYDLNNRPIHISRTEGCIGINGACIVARDITLTNGVLHVIDRLI